MAKKPTADKAVIEKPEVAEIEDAVVLEEAKQSNPGEHVQPDDDKSAELKDDEAPEPAKADAVKRVALVPLFIGGLTAGAIGFAAALFVTGDFGPFRPDSTATDRLAAENTRLKAELATLEAEFSGHVAQFSELPTGAQLDNLSDRQINTAGLVEAQTAAISDLAGRVADIENRPIPMVGATAEAVATYERELTAMRQMFATELARIESAQQESTSRQVDAAIQSEVAALKLALAGIQSAVESGVAYSVQVALFSDAGIEVPVILTAQSVAGVVTLAELQQLFPNAARAALDAAFREQADDGTVNKLTAFLRSQLGVRSLGPREGDGADAVLSRAEDALRNGNIDAAILEISALPEASKEKMANWVDIAQIRQAVITELSDFSATLGN